MWARLLGCTFAWALLFVAASTNASAQPDEPPVDQLDPESPMAAMPDIGIDWPDMESLASPLPASPDEAAEVQHQSTEIVGERRYRLVLEGLDVARRPAIVELFNAVSTLKAGEGKPANAAQIERRARADAELLDQILDTEGYYDADVETFVESGEAGRFVVRLKVEPGPVYRFSEVDVTGLEGAADKATELREKFAVSRDDPVNADNVLTGRAALVQAMRKEGYPFAKVGEPQLVVDHDSQSATLSMNVDPGGLRQFGEIRLSGSKLPFDARHVGRIARFRTGDAYDQSKLDDLRRALVATGLVSEASVSPVPAENDKFADVAVVLERAKVRTVAAEAGYGTGEGVRAEVSWTHRNLIRPEGAVTFRGVVGTREQYVGAILRQSNFRKRDQVLNARIEASQVDRRAYEARSLDIATGIERQTNIIWQKKWTWSAGTQFLATSERDSTRIANSPRRTFFIAALPATLNYDGSDDLLDPKRGFRLGFRVAPEISLEGGAFGYVRSQFDGSFYLPAGNKVVLAGRARLGAISGSPTRTIAPSRRLYSGGGGSVRGFAYQRIGPRDAANDPVGGRSLMEFGLEARVRFGNFGIVPFLDGGKVDSGSIPDFSDFRFGAGVGARYYSSFGPIRIDVGTPVNPQTGDPRVTVFVSLGQAF